MDGPLIQTIKPFHGGGPKVGGKEFTHKGLIHGVYSHALIKMAIVVIRI